MIDVSRYLSDARQDIMRKVLSENSNAAQRTIIAEVIVSELIDHLGYATANSNTGDLEVWLGQLYDRYGALPYLSAMLESACLAVMDTGKSEGWLESDELIRPAARIVARAIHSPRAAPTEVASETIDTIDITINDLIARLFEKDVLTGEHSRAVSLWCIKLARKLGLDANQTLAVQRGGLLHDIGKIATPNEVLNAPRRLTLEEREIIERHPVEGAEIMIDVPLLGDLMPMVRSHHERPDGKGYPDGLAGDEISLAVRIVTVADCFNAMIGRRPYRPPLAPSVALEELERHRGTHFDAELVAAMNLVVDDYQRL